MLALLNVNSLCLPPPITIWLALRDMNQTTMCLKRCHSQDWWTKLLKKVSLVGIEVVFHRVVAQVWAAIVKWMHQNGHSAIPGAMLWPLLEFLCRKGAALPTLVGHLEAGYRLLATRSQVLWSNKMRMWTLEIPMRLSKNKKSDHSDSSYSSKLKSFSWKLTPVEISKSNSISKRDV